MEVKAKLFIFDTLFGASLIAIGSVILVLCLFSAIISYSAEKCEVYGRVTETETKHTMMMCFAKDEEGNFELIGEY